MPAPSTTARSPICLFIAAPPRYREAAPRGCSVPRPEAARLCSAMLAVDLLVPQPGHDPVHAQGEVAAVGAERQPERRGGPLLGGGGTHIGPLDSPPQLVVARVLAQGLHRRTHQRLQRRRHRLLVSGTVTYQAGPQQRVAREEIWPAQVAQRL